MLAPGRPAVRPAEDHRVGRPAGLGVVHPQAGPAEVPSAAGKRAVEKPTAGSALARAPRAAGSVRRCRSGCSRAAASATAAAWSGSSRGTSATDWAAETGLRSISGICANGSLIGTPMMFSGRPGPESLRMLVMGIAKRRRRPGDRRQVDRDDASGVGRGPAQHVLGIRHRVVVAQDRGQDLRRVAQVEAAAAQVPGGRQRGVEQVLWIGYAVAVAVGRVPRPGARQELHRPHRARVRRATADAAGGDRPRCRATCRPAWDRRSGVPRCRGRRLRRRPRGPTRCARSRPARSS